MVSGLARSIAIATLLALGSLAMTPAARADTDQQKLDVAKAMFKAWEDLDWERVYALFADDGVLHSMMMEPVKGRAAIRERLSKMAPGVERIALQVAHLGIVDGLVFVERVDDFVYKGHAGRVPVVGVLEIEGGQVKVWREYYDHAQLAAAMGLVPATPAH